MSSAVKKVLLKFSFPFFSLLLLCFIFSSGSLGSGLRSTGRLTWKSPLLDVSLRGGAGGFSSSPFILVETDCKTCRGETSEIWSADKLLPFDMLEMCQVLFQVSRVFTIIRKLSTITATFYFLIEIMRSLSVRGRLLPRWWGVINSDQDCSMTHSRLPSHAKLGLEL